MKPHGINLSLNYQNIAHLDYETLWKLEFKLTFEVNGLIYGAISKQGLIQQANWDEVGGWCAILWGPH